MPTPRTNQESVPDGTPDGGVLLICDDDQLIWQWSAILEREGLRVGRATSDDVSEQLRAKAFNVALVCHSVSPSSVFKLVDDMRRNHPRTKLVAMLGAINSSGYPWLFDECLEPLCGPKTLLASMRRWL